MCATVRRKTQLSLERPRECGIRELDSRFNSNDTSSGFQLMTSGGLVYSFCIPAGFH